MLPCYINPMCFMVFILTASAAEPVKDVDTVDADVSLVLVEDAPVNPWSVPVHFVRQSPVRDFKGRPIPRPKRHGAKFMVGVAALAGAITLGVVVTSAGDQRLRRL